MLRQFMRSWLAPGAGLSLAIAWAFGPGLIACTRNAGDDDANDESSGQIPHDDPEASGESGALEGADDTPPWDLDDPDAGTLSPDDVAAIEQLLIDYFGA